MSAASMPARAMASRMTTAPEVRGGQVLEHAAERSDRGPAGAENDGVIHLYALCHSLNCCDVIAQLDAVAELLERFGIGERLAILHSRPCTTSRTASSTILPLLVRGMSLTCTMRAGTCRGVVLRRICCRMRSSSCVVERRRRAA